MVAGARASRLSDAPHRRGGVRGRVHRASARGQGDNCAVRFGREVPGGDWLRARRLLDEHTYRTGAAGRRRR